MALSHVSSGAPRELSKREKEFEAEKGNVKLITTAVAAAIAPVLLMYNLSANSSSSGGSLLFLASFGFLLSAFWYCFRYSNTNVESWTRQCEIEEIGQRVTNLPDLISQARQHPEQHNLTPDDHENELITKQAELAILKQIESRSRGLLLSYRQNAHTLLFFGIGFACVHLVRIGNRSYLLGFIS